MTTTLHNAPGGLGEVTTLITLRINWRPSDGPGPEGWDWPSILEGPDRDVAVVAAYQIGGQVSPKVCPVAVAEAADRLESSADDLDALERMAAGSWNAIEACAVTQVEADYTPEFKRAVCDVLFTKATVASGRA